MTAFYRVFITLFLLAIPWFRLTTGKKSKEQLQNILMHTFGHFSESKSEPAPLVLPWKRPATVIKYDDILTFTDESEITDNHICRCRLEEFKDDSIDGSFEGAL